MKKGSLTSTILRLMLALILLSSGLATFAIANLAYSLGDARAINASGSLRMQSYRLMFYANSGSEGADDKIREFEATLHSDALKRSLDWMTPDDLASQYLLVIQKWQVMKQYIEEENSRLYVSALKDFVDTIDLFVLETEEFAAFKLKLLAASQITGLGLMLLIAFFAVRFTKRKVVTPLNQLMESANTISKGEFDVTMPDSEYIELSSLSNALATSARELSTLYNNLENQVKEKTFALTRANNELKLLYDNLVMLHSGKLEISTLKQALNQLRAHEPNSFLRLVIAQDDKEKLYIDADGGWPIASRSQTRFPLKFADNELGYLEVTALGEINHPLFENFAIMLARSIVIYNAGEQRQQLALMEERGVIARELHDSLGQLLSFLKIQVNLLSKGLDSQCRSPQVEEQLKEINEGVNTAYVQLRELLSTFRLTIKDPNLNHAIEMMLDQLRGQTTAKITLEDKLPIQLLGAHQHIHVLQLTREATLNAIKHAQADHIHICCTRSGNNVKISISDDGVGLEKLKERDQHFGIGIMHERASRLSGVVDFSSNEQGGTTVTLLFPPEQEPRQ
ncbi:MULTISPECIES: nitrate/nitrite two-component system sensor histidine kinase NarQ [Shewanella]|uniref:nitrate/nitrite two-component system sensor histidine kinase NarQ n=1 Tax=Shewanella TaxID=22 RepID=UPI001181E83C|nr:MULTISPECIES: nitrate/nitrite two-component system sensor histidine kinase NarQ [Shewanella]QYJ83249.1 nitrate/nitrite two-component system sensor histidine kinase NarQ [Shewanella aegiceratis]QYJ94615.1 nitrate/nitrite two-component system sensor histidine kinase NarQ [Shewanella spartinae]QYJ98468.1 nitrate/nitrite two-component system sensor histidine kinase NarQ [Shewanella alkalitolerans]TVP10840.1 two-component system sensor histidine kinase NarQ [Shewanella sp. KCT]